MFKLNILESLLQIIVGFFQFGMEGSLALVRALTQFAKTDSGKLLFGEILSGFIITPMSLACDLLWGIAAYIIFKDSKYGKWVMSVIAFLVGMLISGIGATEWCVIILPAITAITALVLQSYSKLLGNKRINDVK